MRLIWVLCFLIIGCKEPYPNGVEIINLHGCSQLAEGSIMRDFYCKSGLIRCSKHNDNDGYYWAWTCWGPNK